MAFFVYLIGNYKFSKLTTYVGYTNNIKKRISLHNSGKGAKFTKGRSWKLLYYEKFKTKKEALSREYYIKKNRKFRNLIKKKYK
jgi:putative endonuclease